MSHYSVAVFTDEYTSIEELLEPFDENLKVDKYIAFTKEEIIKNGRKSINNAKKIYKEYIKDKKSFRRKYFNNIQYLRYLKKIPLMAKWNNEKIYKDQIKHYDPDMISEDGGVYSTYNTNSKWDWYYIGGRWENMLIIEDRNNPKTFIHVNSAKVKDIRWDLMSQEASKNIIPYEKFISSSFLPKKYMESLYPTEEIYTKCQLAFNTYAVLTPDGEWHEPGPMGWFGISFTSPKQQNEFILQYEEKFLKNVNPEWTLTIVDCHI